MTPLEIEIVMHYYTTPGDYRGGDFKAPAVAEALIWMFHEKILVASSGGTEYEIGPRGSAFIKALQQVPLPIEQWVVEWPQRARS